MTEETNEPTNTPSEDTVLDEALHNGGWWDVVHKAYSVPYYYDWNKGTISRIAYLKFMGFQYLLIVALGIIAVHENRWSQIIMSISGLFVFLPTVTMLGRRLHKIHRSAWILIPVFVIPYVAFYIFLYLFLFAFLNEALKIVTPSTFFSMAVIAGAFISFLPLMIVGLMPDKIALKRENNADEIPS